MNNKFKELIKRNVPSILIIFARKIRHSAKLRISKRYINHLLKERKNIYLEIGAGNKKGENGWITLDLTSKCDIYLNELFKNYRIHRCDFLKIDCEGAEYNIFYHTSDKTFNKIRTISMEFHDVEGNNSTGLELLRYLVEKGFNVAKFNYNETHLNLNFGEMILTKEKIITVA